MIACQLIAGRFRIDDLEHDLRGRGGKGAVYRAADTLTGCPVEGEAHAPPLCRLVGGMPLGILLAAAWVAVLTPVGIAVETGQSPDLLGMDLRVWRHNRIAVVF